MGCAYGTNSGKTATELGGMTCVVSPGLKPDPADQALDSGPIEPFASISFQSEDPGNSKTSKAGKGSIVSRQQPHHSLDTAVDEVRRNYLAGTLTVDPRCPLNDRQLYGLTKSWKAINRNMTVTAINMFVRLFETNYEIKDMFAKFKDVETIADLRSNKVLEGHAMKVICTIDDAIVCMDDMDYVIRMLQTVAQSHSIRFPHFNPEFFSRIEDPFILAVKEELGDRFTISVETTYRTTIRFILSTMTEEFIRCRQLQQQALDSVDNEDKAKLRGGKDQKQSPGDAIKSANVDGVIPTSAIGDSQTTNRG